MKIFAYVALISITTTNIFGMRALTRKNKQLASYAAITSRHLLQQRRTNFLTNKTINKLINEHKMNKLNLSFLSILLSSSLHCMQHTLDGSQRSTVIEDKDHIDIQLMKAICIEGMAKVKALLNSGANVNHTDARGWTPLMIAVSRNCDDIGFLQILLEAGADVNARGSYGETAIMIATCNGFINSLNLLLESGANLNIPDENGHTPLMEAIVLGDSKIITALLNAGADVNAATAERKTALMIAVEYGNTEIVIALLKAGADVRPIDNCRQNALDISKYRPNQEIKYILAAYLLAQKANSATVNELLIIASMGNDVDKIKDVLSAGADINATDENGHTALMIAARCGHIDIVNILLKSGANMETASRQWTALIQALYGGDDDKVISLLKAGADINAIDGRERRACDIANIKIKYFLASRSLTQKSDSAGAEDDNCINKQLIIAATGNDTARVEDLLRAGANVNHTDEHGCTPLIVAVGHRNIDIVNILLQAGADVTDKLGIRALNIAMHYLDADIIRALSKSGVNIDYIDSGDFSRTPLMKAARLGHTELVKILLNEGADVNARDVLGDTALILAAESRYHIETFNALLNAGADINITNNSGTTALMRAITYSNHNAIRALAQAGIDVNRPIEGNDFIRGETPLIFALKYNKINVINALLQAGAEVSATDSAGKNALDRHANYKIFYVLRSSLKLEQAQKSVLPSGLYTKSAAKI